MTILKYLYVIYDILTFWSFPDLSLEGYSSAPHDLTHMNTKINLFFKYICLFLLQKIMFGTVQKNYPSTVYISVQYIWFGSRSFGDRDMPDYPSHALVRLTLCNGCYLITENGRGGNQVEGEKRRQQQQPPVCGGICLRIIIRVHHHTAWSRL